MNRKSKAIKYLITIMLIFLMPGCAYYLGAPIGGVLLTDLKGPIGYDASTTNGDYEILGEVQGEAKVSTILGIFATGDASIAAAYNDALKKIQGANALINVKIDYRAQSALALFASHTTIVTGTAIRRDKTGSPISEEQMGDTKQPVTSQAATPKIAAKAPEPISSDVLDFRLDVLKTLQNNEKLFGKFTARAKNEGKPETPDIWVETLDEKALRFFKNSRYHLNDWLDRVFENKIYLK